MKIVKFKDGTYGIRRGHWFFSEYSFKDLESSQDFWWTLNSPSFHYCKGDLESVTKLYNDLTDVGKPID